MRPLLRCLARPMNDEWKMSPYLGVLPLVFSALWHSHTHMLAATHTHTHVSCHTRHHWRHAEQLTYQLIVR